MARRYDSFVLRCWRLDGGARRVEVEHLQSGGRTHAATLAAAAGWIVAQCGDAGAGAPGARPQLVAAAEEVMPNDARAPDGERIG